MSVPAQIKQELTPALTHDDTLTSSPTESFIGTPRDAYSSLFEAGSPQDFGDEADLHMEDYSPAPEQAGLTPIPEDSTTPTDKAQPKKRKGWGQVLPQPKTNLPPRKRAKTDDEKEQRRVERVLRNRRAAQSSRERKRQEVENLEKRNQELEALLANEKQTNLLLLEQLQRFRGNSLKDNPAMFQELFVSRDQSHSSTDELTTSVVDSLLRQTENKTLDPTALSPPLGPVPDQEDCDTISVQQPTEVLPASSPDLTQRPAVMLCDLQCQSVERQETPNALEQTAFLATMFKFQVWMLMAQEAILSTCQRPMMQIAMSLTAGFSIRPTPQLLTTIIWLVSRPSPRSTSISSSTSTAATRYQTLWQRVTAPRPTRESPSECPTLRVKFLRKLLASSPSLARPLLDATVVALRLVPRGCDDQVGPSTGETLSDRGDNTELMAYLKSASLPSWEVLVTLLWTLTLFEHGLEKSKSEGSNLLSASIHGPQHKYQYKVRKGRAVQKSRLARSRPSNPPNGSTNVYDLECIGRDATGIRGAKGKRASRALFKKQHRPA